MKIRTPKISIFSSNSDRLQNFGVGSVVVGLAGAIGLCPIMLQAAFALPAPITLLNAPYMTGTTKTFSTTISNPTNIPSAGVPTTLNFGVTPLNDRYIKTFQATVGGNSKTFNFSGLVTNIYIRRNNDTNFLNKNRQIAFFENSSGTYNSLISSYSADMETILRSQTINRGSDNTFVNTALSGAGNVNNIERVDFVNPAGLKAPSDPTQLDDIGFIVLERGGNDNVKIAAITGVDASGNPTSYGTVVTQTSLQWGLLQSINYTVMRKDASDPDWRPSDKGSQQIGGIYFSFGSLGVTAGQTIYGYSIIPADVNATGSGLLDWTTYPTNTVDTDGNKAGIDLMAGGGIFATHIISGTVFKDSNGTQIQDNSEAGTNAGGLNAVLIDSTGVVLQVKPISATDGTYKFTGVSATRIPNFGDTPYKVVITTANPAINSMAAVPSILPAGYVTTGENKSGVVDGVPDGTLTVSVSGLDPVSGQPTSTTTPGINFGIEQLPTAIAVAVPTQANPGSTATANIPPGSFNTSTDPDGTVTSYKITAFPSNVTSITIDGVVYTATAQMGTIAFPTGGVTVLAAHLNTIKVDPIDGVITVQILFKAIDNAGKESANTATVDVPFSTVIIAPPQLILLKRITMINGGTTAKASNGSSIDLTTVVAQPDNPDTPRDESKDSTIDSSNAPTSTPWPAANYPKGSIDAGVIKTGDTIEYTIYFLSSGGKPVTNANLCDWVPENTTFEPNSYGIGQGIQLAIGSILNTLTNVPDSDRGVFFNPNSVLPTTYPTGSTSLLTCRTPAGSQGAVVVNLVRNTLPAPNDQLPNATAAGNPGNSYGFIRFVSKVK
jgi:uncharacterized repeat protein (TIGR01451 family)